MIAEIIGVLLTIWVIFIICRIAIGVVKFVGYTVLVLLYPIIWAVATFGQLLEWVLERRSGQEPGGLWTAAQTEFCQDMSTSRQSGRLVGRAVEWVKRELRRESPSRTREPVIQDGESVALHADDFFGQLAAIVKTMEMCQEFQEETGGTVNLVFRSNPGGEFIKISREDVDDEESEPEMKDVTPNRRGLGRDRCP